MDFSDQIKTMAMRLPGQLPHIQTEESTKNALVLPMLNALGFNVFDPTEVIPEFIADVGIKKGEKVDYAITLDGKPIIIVECKKCQTCLDLEHASQLYRYFSVTETRFAILTDGITYMFYTDLERPNQLDSKPFFIFNLEKFKEDDLNELKKFSKSTFDIDSILTTAADLKYTKLICDIFKQEYKEPSEDFIRFFASKVYDGRLTSSTRENFKNLTKKAFQKFMRDQIEERLEGVNRALDEEGKLESSGVTQEETIAEAAPSREDRITTTQEELEGYHLVKAILRNIVEPSRVVMRDTISYCGVLLDDNNRKPICRLHFNGKQKYLGLFDENKTETRYAIDNIDDIFAFADSIIKTIGFYDGDSAQNDQPIS